MADMTKQFKALANKNRLAIFEYLRRHGSLDTDALDEAGGNNVGSIAEQFDLALSTISHHLRVLHEADLIICEQHGKHTYCVVNTEAVKELRAFLDMDTTQS